MLTSKRKTTYHLRTPGRDSQIHHPGPTSTSETVSARFSLWCFFASQVSRLEQTWTALRQRHTEGAILYEKTLRPFMKSLNEGRGRGPTACFKHWTTASNLVSQWFLMVNFLTNSTDSVCVSVRQKAVRCPIQPSPTSYPSCLCWRRALRWVRARSRGRRWKSGWTWSCSTWGRRGPSHSWGAFTAPTPRANSKVMLLIVTRLFQL